MNMSRILSSLLLTVITAYACAFNVVIDAGHGGKDPGACGALTTEKALNLKVAQKLASLIRDSCPEVKVFLTRNSDVFLSLQQRADFVNSHHADLFICIHANAAENRTLSGYETYTLGLHKLESNFEVAKRENSVMLLEDDYQLRYQGFNPGSVESYIMFEFMQDRYLERSLQFASLVQSAIASHSSSRTDRGVRQAGFWVLHASSCPSVLIETGFISNSEEEKYLSSARGINDVAHSIFSAFVSYLSSLNRRIDASVTQ